MTETINQHIIMTETVNQHYDVSHSLDPMFADAARLVVETQCGSASWLQRQFEIGFNRANRLVEQLEAVGIIGADRKAKGREVLIQDSNILEQKLQELGV